MLAVNGVMRFVDSIPIHGPIETGDEKVRKVWTKLMNKSKRSTQHKKSNESVSATPIVSDCLVSHVSINVGAAFQQQAAIISTRVNPGKCK